MLTSQIGRAEKTNPSTHCPDPTQRFTLHRRLVLGVSDCLQACVCTDGRGRRGPTGSPGLGAACCFLI